MNSIAKPPRPPLRALDRSILTLHAAVAAVVGVVGFLQANDPGWGDLQRLVILVMITLWAGGIVAMAVLVRFVGNKWLRSAILLGGPFIGIALVFGRSMLGLG